ncbi:ttuE [Symbiodinium natans]|uniref:Pyruvate kinase n=1 Tax=Symbiodinium natans TaxID=878477 RepID=A0A812LQB7_9DINO|nr:ttuE [Symbiodinium natans]
MEEQEGAVCSIWLGADDAKAAPIPADVLEADSASLLDKDQTIDGVVVRSCRKGAKQVATIGPASSSDEMLERLFLCGVDVFRLNFSHGEHAEKLDLISRIRDIEEKYRHPIAILADMQGPKQRCGKFEDPGGVELKLGQLFRFDMDPALGNEKRVQLPHPEILQALEPGKDQRLLLDDGKIRMKVVRKGFLVDGEEVEDATHEGATPFVECEVTVPGHLGERKGVNTPDVILPMSPITKKDREDLKFCCKHSVDWIAMSFVQKHEDMEELRDIVVETHGRPDIRLLAKIEKPSAVDDLQNILKACDGVMVARGDLGVEMNPQDVPFVQKEIIQTARFQGKPVIVATQMLETMITNPMPTRAECSDIANAIIDGCDAVMLSGESAVGKYPAEAVTMQRRVIESAESRMDLARAGPGSIGMDQGHSGSQLATEAVLSSAATLAKDMKACAIVVFTATGNSARLLAQRRPTVPILAVCKCLEVARQVSLIHGVYATSDSEVRLLAAKAEREDAFDKVRFSQGVEIGCRIVREFGLPTSEDDWVVVVARLPLFSQGPLNTSRLIQAGGPQKKDGYGPSDGFDAGAD